MSHLITWNGKTQNLVTWCKELNIPYYLIYHRLKRNWSVDRAFTEPVNKNSGKLITWSGKTQNLAAWAKELNISEKNLRRRFACNWSVDKAFTTQPDKKKRKR